MLPAFVTRPFRSLSNAVERVGFLDATIIAASRVLRRVSAGHCDVTRFYVFSQPLRPNALPQRRRANALTVRAIGADDPLLGRFPRPRHEIAQRFETGSQCFVVEAGGDILGFMWVHQGIFFDTEVGVYFQTQPANETCWDFDVFVQPAQRGGLAFFRLWEGACGNLSRKGVRWSMSRVFAHNEDSIRSHARLGAYAVASAIQLRLGGYMVTLADCAPRFRLSRGRESAPELVVSAVNDAPRKYARFR